MTSLRLKHPIEGFSNMTFEVGKAVGVGVICHEITRAEGGGFWVLVGPPARGNEHLFVPDWRTDLMRRVDPEPPSEHRCKHCSEGFPSGHALKVHVGMKHREHRA